MAVYTGPIKLAILDIAGTVCDGPQDLRHLYPNDDGLAVKGPVIVFDQIFQQYKMDVDWATIRKPMGVFKKEHLQAILEDEKVAAQFRERHGRDWTKADLEEMFSRFRPTVAKVAVTDALIRPFEGVKECVDELRAAGIKVGCDTGYPIEACRAIYEALDERFGIRFDVTADPENVWGRPSPFLVYDCMSKANVYPVEAVVKADDIEAGIHEGRNSGAWTVGLYATGAHGYERLKSARPDYLVPGARYLADLIFTQIQPALLRGKRPGDDLSI